jgi:hypothetical protein
VILNRVKDEILMMLYNKRKMISIEWIPKHFSNVFKYTGIHSYSSSPWPFWWTWCSMFCQPHWGSWRFMRPILILMY